jgi:hypothetical protein
MENEIFLLTVNLPQRTRIQCGCFNDMTQELLFHAARTDTFHSFTKVNLDKLPVRDEDELRRGASFIKDALDSNLTANVKGH